MSTNWWPIRKRLAAFAVILAVMTVLVAAAATGSAAIRILGLGYIALAAGALLLPAAITVQVLGGQFLVGAMILGPGGAGARLWAIPVFVMVVGTAELLTIVARLDSVFERDPAGDYRAATQSALLAGLVFGAVLLMARLPGPGGLIGVVTSAIACTLLGTFIWIRTRDSFAFVSQAPPARDSAAISTAD